MEKTIKITEDHDEFKSAHYIQCTTYERISPFTVKFDDTVTITFMGEILSIEEQ